MRKVLFLTLLLFPAGVGLAMPSATDTPTPQPTTLPALSSKAKAEIAELRKMKASILADIKAKKLKKKTQGTGDNSEWVSDGALFVDPKGRARAYFISEGDGDMAVSNDYFYDPKGRLRVVAHHFGHYAIGTQDQLIFLDEKGEFIRVYVTGSLNVSENADSESGDDQVKTVKVKEELLEPKEGPYTDHVVLVTDPLADFSGSPEKKDKP